MSDNDVVVACLLVGAVLAAVGFLLLITGTLDRALGTGLL